MADAVDPPRVRAKEMQTLTAHEVSRLLKETGGTEWHPLFFLAVYTGLRRSELLGLRWQDLDLAERRLSVVQTLHQLASGELIYEGTKTGKGRRRVSLPPGAVLALRAHRERVEADLAAIGQERAVSRLVFCHIDGGPLRPHSVSQAFRRVERRLGLNARLHDLRHTHASLMLAQGIHPQIVSERLGHANISITLDTYSHIMPGLQEAAALKFEEGLAEAALHAIH